MASELEVGKAKLGTIAMQGDALLGARANGDSINFGHANQSGYGSNLGCGNNNGHPYLAFMCEHGTNNNTFRTRGEHGNVIQATATGELKFSQVTTADADNQTATDRLTIDSTGLATFSNGIAFSQTNSSATGATATGTTLDHYEEGTWTPVYSAGASSSGTWDTTLAGEFTRIGNLVTASMKITGTSMDFSSAGGYRTYSGLPFTGTLKGAGAVSTAHAASFSGTTSTNVGTNMTIIPAETGSGTSVVLAQATYRV